MRTGDVVGMKVCLPRREHRHAWFGNFHEVMFQFRTLFHEAAIRKLQASDRVFLYPQLLQSFALFVLASQAEGQSFFMW